MNIKAAVILIIANLIAFDVALIAVLYNKTDEPVQVQKEVAVKPVEEIKPIVAEISSPHLNRYLNYNQTVAQIKKWSQEAPGLAETGIYGRSTKGTELYYIRIRNKAVKHLCPKVMITACIHGNEPWSASLEMRYISELLSQYSVNENIRKLVDSRDIIFVPVVSPDSYPHSRKVDGVDPNRNFSTDSSKTVAPVRAIQNLHQEFKPLAVMSMHTWGRVYLMPYGDQMVNCPHHDDFVKVASQMAKMSGYRYMRTCDLYKENGGLNNPPISRRTDEELQAWMPIFGTEIDWYYDQGAFPLVMEVGTHQSIPSEANIDGEFKRTWEAFLFFCEESPKLAAGWSLTK